jgi:hypothetical protein
MVQASLAQAPPQPIDLLRQWLPIGVSLLSFAVASVALGWNIYRDVVLKARVRVHFSVVTLLSEGTGHLLVEGGRLLSIGVTNHGPGPVRIELIQGLDAVPLWRRLLGRWRYFVIFKLVRTNPPNCHLPHRLDVCDSVTLFLPYDEKCFLGSDATHIGVSDSYGRYHYAPRKEVEEAKKQFWKDFGAHPQLAARRGRGRHAIDMQ